MLDAGAQVPITNKDKLESIFPDVRMQDVSSILDSYDSLRVQWRDEENVPFVGWVEMPVKIEWDKKMAEVNVPFLVTTQNLNDTILGSNAIKHLVQNRNNTESIVSLFQTVFDEVGRVKMETFVELIKQSKVQDKETEVKVKGKDVINVDLIEKERAIIFQQRDVEQPERIHCADSKNSKSKTIFDFLLSMIPTMMLR